MKMLYVDLVFVVGLLLAIAGVIKRKESRGMWLLTVGIALMFVAFFILGYSDFKTGFLDAMSD